MSSNEYDESREEEYIEEEDEDFNPENQQDSDIIDSDNEDSLPLKKKKKKDNDANFEAETEKEVKNANYSKIENEEGGLIKTRTQRALEIQQEKRYKSVSDNKSSLDVEEAWKKLKEESTSRLKQKYSSSASSNSTQPSQPLVANEKIKVKRTYEYAGEIITEEKWVSRESAEAKSYLSSLKNDEKVESSNDIAETQYNLKKKSVNDDGKRLRIVRKKPPLLEGIINGSIKPKLNTLQKSKVDFAELVDKEGINDELVQNTKDGYLERQDFLSRVQFHREIQIKEIRRKELQNKE